MKDLAQRDISGGMVDVRPDLVRPESWYRVCGMRNVERGVKQRTRKSALFPALPDDENDHNIDDGEWDTTPVWPGPGNPLPPEFASVVRGTYIYLYRDASGSMDTELPIIQAMTVELKNLIRDDVYGGDQIETDQYVHLVDMGFDERWLYRYSLNDAPDNDRYFKVVYMNEAEANYHAYPDAVPENEPTATYTIDHALAVTAISTRAFTGGAVYAITPTTGADTNYFVAFKSHLTRAFGPSGGYPSLAGMNLVWSEQPAGRTADEYLTEIVNRILALS